MRTNRIKKNWLFLLLLSMSGLATGLIRAQEKSPFEVQSEIHSQEGLDLIRVHFDVPEGHYLYADRLRFEIQGWDSEIPVDLPEAKLVHDRYSSKQKRVYQNDFSAKIVLNSSSMKPIELTVSFQGCNQGQCFFPETRVFVLSDDGSTEAPHPGMSTAAHPLLPEPEWKLLVGRFRVVGAASGYLDEDRFLSFLDQNPDAPPSGFDLKSIVGKWGWLVTVILILVGGLGLNLTPCILPMIPINLAIIGAGSNQQKPRRGFVLGGCYGFGMALVYGVLGLMVILTGTRFGTINSSLWFNLAIAIIFAVLAFGMFDILRIDFSRFQQKVQVSKFKSYVYLLPFMMGAIAALLAGACVAPVLISVLLFSTKMFNDGQWIGLVLPFVLGLGMALPWPFAGAGLSVLPKPGKWMKSVKRAFGTAIAIMACYYGYLTYGIWHADQSLPVLAREADVADESQPPSDQMFVNALEQSLVDGLPVFVDFWASWCKSCQAMEHQTFNQPAVLRRLSGFHVVKFQADQMSNHEIKEVLDYFKVMGLPTYVVLNPITDKTSVALISH